MTAIIFAGPSLGQFVPPPTPDLFWRPPAVAGDVYRAARDGAQIIGLVDGHFEHLPAVWHKEILWALDRGVHVIGAASMGALRAAECAAYGMVGVGRIFAAYRDGGLIDDHEVALLHGPPDVGYPPASEPLVNIRATLEAAHGADVLSQEDALALLSLARETNYQALRWPDLLDDAAESAALGAAVTRLHAWLPDGRVDQKRRDAIALVEHVVALMAQPLTPLPAEFDFVASFHWLDAMDEFDRGNRGLPSAEADILDELRLDPRRYSRLLQRAYLKRLLADGTGGSAEAAEPAAAVEAFRSANSLFRKDQFETWLSRHDLDGEALAHALSRQVDLDEELHRVAASLSQDVLTELKIDGGYDALATRARAKRRALNQTTTDDDVSTLSLQMLIEWFYENRLSAEPPNELDSILNTFRLDNFDSVFELLSHEYKYTIID